MKIFAFQENLDNQQKKILARIRQLMNGEVSEQLQAAGMNYKKAFGVSLVHLRQLAKDYQPDNQLAERLWFRDIRETMILATMVANAEDLTDEQLMEWAGQIINIEIAEQMAFNLLGRKKAIEAIVSQWLLHPMVYVRYTALMAIGWHFRFVGNGLSTFIASSFSTLRIMASDKILVRAVTHCLKMAGRFDPILRASVVELAQEWTRNDDPLLQRAGVDILDEVNI